MDKTTQALNEWLKLDEFEKSIIINDNLGNHQIELEDIVKFKKTQKVACDEATKIFVREFKKNILTKERQCDTFDSAGVCTCNS